MASIQDFDFRYGMGIERREGERNSSAAIQISGLQVVISAILKAIGPLVNIALLLLFAIIIFAIVGLEFYAGALNSTCYDITDLSKCDREKNLNRMGAIYCLTFLLG